MTDPQFEALLAQIRELEKSSRRWKLAAIGLALVLLLLVTLGGVTSLVLTVGYASARNEALRAMDAARQQEMQARDEAEAQRQLAEQQRQQAEKRLEEAKRANEKKQ